MRRLAVVLVASASFLVLPTAHAGAGAIVAVTDFQFTPATVSARATPGVSILSFQNGGSFAHTATSDTGMFDTGQIAPATSQDSGIYGAGLFPYHCENHPALMIGAIRVRPTASDTSVSVGDSITLRVGADFLKGVVFDVQRRRNGGGWVSVRSDTFDPTPTFRLTRAGTYEFRARTELYLQGKRSQWSPIRAVSAV